MKFERLHALATHELSLGPRNCEEIVSKESYEVKEEQCGPPERYENERAYLNIVSIRCCESYSHPVRYFITGKIISVGNGADVISIQVYRTRLLTRKRIGFENELRVL